MAKGFCILMVVYFHISKALKVSYPLEDLTSKIRMPLYFLLSGLFFKEYENFIGFLKRKINKLLIPFLFSYLTITIPYTIYKGHTLGEPLSSSAKEILLGVYNEYFINIPTWFLFCLFLTCLLFYSVVAFSNKYGDKKVIVMIVMSLVVGIVGIILSYTRCDLPFFIDTSLTATPLYCLGYLLNKHSNILRKSKVDRYLLLIIPLMFLAAYLVDGNCHYRNNHYWTHPLLLYPSCGLAAVAMVLLAKMIKHIPWVTYMGRYSIILLMFHEPIQVFVVRFLRMCHIKEGYTIAWVTFFLTCIILTLMIPICKKFLPYVTAQKDLIKVGPSHLDSDSSKRQGVPEQGGL